ncbi:hypothetical protein DPEC_G00037040 [Dallia pectoralis]|uniref:Uncharacterized protein n=1 Tax=Dallia pectoralis TaxID=75939 RepID=A0ACC2HDP1_DALPE|nr:hypothetical protein DPEC_G00037040 [Dallia pectoralis]
MFRLLAGKALSVECNRARTKDLQEEKNEMRNLRYTNLSCLTDINMDLVLDVADHYFLTPYVYPLSWPEDRPLRQIISLLAVTNLGIVVLYLCLGWLSYQFIYDHNLMRHPLFLTNQVWREIKLSMTSLPIISLPTVAIFFLEVRGYSRLYDTIEYSLMENASYWPSNPIPSCT